MKSMKNIVDEIISLSKSISLFPGSRMMKSKSGQIINNVIGAVIAVIMYVAVAIPVTQDIIDNTTLTGTTSTIVNLLPLFLALGALLAVIGGFLAGGAIGNRT